MGAAAGWEMPPWEPLSLLGRWGGRALPAPQFLAPLAAADAGPAARLLFGPGLAARVVRVSLISWKVVFGLGMNHGVKTRLGEGLLNLFLRVLLIYPSIAFSGKVCQDL